MPACPRCAVPLRAHTITTDHDAWEIELDVCMDSCGGIWLDKHDFEVDPQAKLLLDQELLGLNIPRKKNINTKAPADCPACRVPMHRYDWNNEGIHLDACPMCQGRWLDGGEVRTIHQQWHDEPVDTAPTADLMRKVKEVKKATEAGWKEENFWQWAVKRMMLTSTRDKQ